MGKRVKLKNGFIIYDNDEIYSINSPVAVYSIFIPLKSDHFNGES